MSFGLHSGAGHHFDEGVRDMLKWWAAERAAGRAPRLLWRATSAQHFATTDGRYHSESNLVTTTECKDLSDMAQHADAAQRLGYADGNLTSVFEPFASFAHFLPTFGPTLAIGHREHIKLRPGGMRYATRPHLR